MSVALTRTGTANHPRALSEGGGILWHRDLSTALTLISQQFSEQLSSFVALEELFVEGSSHHDMRTRQMRSMTAQKNTLMQWHVAALREGQVASACRDTMTEREG